MGGVELGAQPPHVGDGQRARRHGDRQLERLAVIAKIDAAEHLAVTRRDTVAVEAGGTLHQEIREQRLQRLGRQRVESHPPRGDELVAKVGHQHADRGGDAGVRRDQHGGDAELARQCVGVQRSGAAEGDEHELAGIVAALHGHQAHRADHVGVGDLHDAGGGGDRVERQWRGHAVGDGLARGGGVQRHLAAEEERGVQPAEDQVGVGDGRRGAAAAVAGRARPRACAARAHAERAARVDPRFAAATGADLHQIDHRRADGIAAAAALAERGHRLGADLDLGGQPELAVLDEADLGGRPAHVERHHVLVAVRRRDGARCDDAGGRTRLDHVDGARLGRG